MELELSLFEELELSLFLPESSFDEPLELASFDFVESDEEDDDEPESLLEELARPLADADEDERESVMYQPLPLKTMPTGWITLRSAPPHCAHVVSGGSEKLWRFSITSSQAVHL